MGVQFILPGVRIVYIGEGATRRASQDYPCFKSLGFHLPVFDVA